MPAEDEDPMGICEDCSEEVPEDEIELCSCGDSVCATCMDTRHGINCEEE